MKICSILISILFGQICFGQNNRIDSLYNEFKSDIKILQQKNKESLIWDNDTRLTYYSLMDICSNETLLKFIDDSNSIVRTYMYLGLLRNNEDSILQKEILQKYRNDTTKFRENTGGCVSWPWKVINHMEWNFKAKQENHLEKINYKKEIEKINNEQRFVINGARHGIIKKEKLQELDSLTYSISECKVNSFDIYIDAKRKFSFTSSDNRLTETMKKEIKKMQSGDGLYFDNIRVKLTNNKIRNVGTIKLIIQ